jgi:hypothetical protein
LISDIARVVEITKTAAAERYVSELMEQRENSCPWSILSIQADQGKRVIRKRESTGNIDFYAAEMGNQHPRVLDGCDPEPKDAILVSNGTLDCQSDSKPSTNAFGDVLRMIFDVGGNIEKRNVASQGSSQFECGESTASCSFNRVNKFGTLLDVFPFSQAPVVRERSLSRWEILQVKEGSRSLVDAPDCAKLCDCGLRRADFERLEALWRYSHTCGGHWKGNSNTFPNPNQDSRVDES